MGNFDQCFAEEASSWGHRQNIKLERAARPRDRLHRGRHELIVTAPVGYEQSRSRQRPDRLHFEDKEARRDTVRFSFSRLLSRDPTAALGGWLIKCFEGASFECSYDTVRIAVVVAERPANSTM